MRWPHLPATAPCWFAIWEGWPTRGIARDAPTFTTHEGELLLYTGTFADFDTAVEAFGAPPSLCWPDDRSWVLARFIDSECVHLACTSQLADAVVAQHSLDARRVRPDDAFQIEDY